MNSICTHKNIIELRSHSPDKTKPDARLNGRVRVRKIVLPWFLLFAVSCVNERDPCFMTAIELITDERVTLKDYKLAAPHVLMKLKSDALVLLGAGVTIPIVAGIVNRTEATIREWERQWNRSRLASIYTSHAGNLNASKLSAAQRAEVAGVLAAPPSPDGLPVEFWSVPRLRDWVEARVDVVYESPGSYHFLMRMAGLSFHTPEAFDRRRGDEAAIETRVAEIREEIGPYLADPGTIVYAADEVRIDQEAVLRRAWYTTGRKTTVKVDRERDSQNYIGFLNQESGECELARLEWQNGPLT